MFHQFEIKNGNKGESHETLQDNTSGGRFDSRNKICLDL